MSVPGRPDAARALLLDIEGTTTPISFVYETLFPYARQRMADFVRERQSQPDVRDDLRLLREEYRQDVMAGATPPPWPEGDALEPAVAYLHWLMDQDRKAPALKSLQGKVWEDGYRGGALRGQVFPDVPPALARWREHGRAVAIFSSGSALAQRLLFSHSTEGDLSPFIQAYFDTTLGPKLEPTSYARIADSLGLAPADVLFVSDAAAELDAARAAGMQTALSVRPGNQPVQRNDHPRIRTFDDLDWPNANPSGAPAS